MACTELYDLNGIRTTAQNCLKRLHRGQYQHLLDQCSELIQQRVHYLGHDLSGHPTEQMDQLFQWQTDDTFFQLRRCTSEQMTVQSGFPVFRRSDSETLLAALGFSRVNASRLAAVVLVWENEQWRYHNLCQFLDSELSGWAPSVEEAEAHFKQAKNDAHGNPSYSIHEPREVESEGDDDYWNQYDEHSKSTSAAPATAAKGLGLSQHSSSRNSMAEDSYWSQYDTASPAPEASPSSSARHGANAGLELTNTQGQDAAQGTSLPPRVVTSALTFNQDAVSPVDLIQRLQSLSESDDDHSHDLPLGTPPTSNTELRSDAASAVLPNALSSQVAPRNALDYPKFQTLLNNDQPLSPTSLSPSEQPQVIKPHDLTSWTDSQPPKHGLSANLDNLRNALRALHGLGRSLNVSDEEFLALTREVISEGAP
ncbi:hypothetical protein IWQ62_002558 [Dispira parvispora]|uniref:Uncharacterized protein n=1 Tax=Dispira parvispora TaxID=1520584 RepID=A0A9W8APQ9_9FUNG|nr:hypothetical protein IWQ62_002558 [Dispira parvispora]